MTDLHFCPECGGRMGDGDAVSALGICSGCRLRGPSPPTTPRLTDQGHPR